MNDIKNREKPAIMQSIGINLNFVKTLPLGFCGFFCLLFISAGGFSCGSKDSDTPNIFSGNFTPTVQLVPGLSNTIYLDSTNLKPNEFLVLDVTAVLINGLVEEARFNIDFSGSVIQYESFAPGDFFGTEDEVQYNFTSNQNNPNRISFNISRKDLSVVTGSGKLISIRFRLVGFGNSGFQFTDNVLLQPSGQALFPMNWFGGNISST